MSTWGTRITSLRPLSRVKTINNTNFRTNFVLRKYSISSFSNKTNGNRFASKKDDEWRLMQKCSIVMLFHQSGKIGVSSQRRLYSDESKQSSERQKTEGNENIGEDNKQEQSEKKSEEAEGNAEGNNKKAHDDELANQELELRNRIVEENYTEFGFCKPFKTRMAFVIILAIGIFYILYESWTLKSKDFNETLVWGCEYDKVRHLRQMRLSLYVDAFGISIGVDMMKKGVLKIIVASLFDCDNNSLIRKGLILDIIAWVSKEKLVAKHLIDECSILSVLRKYSDEKNERVLMIYANLLNADPSIADELATDDFFVNSMLNFYENENEVNNVEYLRIINSLCVNKSFVEKFENFSKKTLDYPEIYDNVRIYKNCIRNRVQYVKAGNDADISLFDPSKGEFFGAIVNQTFMTFIFTPIWYIYIYKSLSRNGKLTTNEYNWFKKTVLYALPLTIINANIFLIIRDYKDWLKDTLPWIPSNFYPLISLLSFGVANSFPWASIPASINIHGHPGKLSYFKMYLDDPRISS